MWTAAAPEEYLERWQLEVAGERRETPSSVLIPVRHRGELAMLKVARVEEEGYGCRLLAWWNGRGAARVWEADDYAAVIEYARPGTPLSSLAATDDGAATRILCDLLLTLHGASALLAPPGGLVPLDTWFAELFRHAEERDSIWQRAAANAELLLADVSQDVVLHGDLHHGNVLDFGVGDWRAIDPKSVVGNRMFDYTSLMFNPTPELAEHHFATRLEIISAATNAEMPVMAQWVFVSAALSASWFAREGRESEASRLLRLAHRAELEFTQT